MLRCALIALVLAMSLGCDPTWEVQEDPRTTRMNELTSLTGVERGIHFESMVFVPVVASDRDISMAIARQVKTAIGALRYPQVALQDREARSNLDPRSWKRETVRVMDPALPQQFQEMLRVTYTYKDLALVSNDLSWRSSISFVMLADNYAEHVEPLKTDCSDDPTTETGSLWFHFQPQKCACEARIMKELDTIRAQSAKLGAGTIPVAEARRWFIPVTARLDPPQTPDRAYSPEYTRLFGLGSTRSRLVVYALFGVHQVATNPDDLLAQEAIKFLRTLLDAQPNFRPVSTKPHAWLLDIYVDGRKIGNVTYQRMFRWILDKTDYPPEVGTDSAKIAALRAQALQKFLERWISWDLPVEVTDQAGVRKELRVQVRFYYGYEDGSSTARQHAQWRYLEAFWHGDVFLYNGHSHFGHGPLEPTLYSPANFNERYQIMLINSCVSYNYYHEDFLEMKPGGSANLDMVVNGLPSYVLDGGVAVGRFLAALIGGTMPTYPQLLDAMKLDYPWGEIDHDPLRAVDGELDNRFSQTATPLTLRVLPPVY